MTHIVKRRTVIARHLHDGMMVDFDDGEPGIVTGVQHKADLVMFDARGTAWTLGENDNVVVVLRMQLMVGG